MPTLDEDIVWAALVLEEIAGTNVGTTGLVPKIGGRFDLEVPGDVGERVVFYGYRDGDLGPDLPRDPAVLRNPLGDAQLPEPILPLPRVQARAELAPGAVFEPDDALRELSAPWIPSCEPLRSAEPDPSVLVSCVARNCRPTIRQDRCHIELDLTGNCGLGVLDLKWLPDSSTRVAANSGSLERCQSIPARPGADFGLLCLNEDGKKCRVDAYPNASRVEMEVEEIKLDPSAPEQFSGAHLLGGIALLDERELVASLANDAGCQPGGDHRLVFVDRTTFEISRTATTSFCFSLMTKDPFGTGFIGIARDPATAVRFDREGQLLTARPLENLVTPAPQVPLAWSLSVDGASAAIWISTPSRDGRTVSDFIELELDDFSVSGQTSNEGDANYPVALTPSAFVLLDDQADALRYFDRVGGTERHNIPLVTDSLTNRSLWAMTRIEDSERLILFINSPRDTIAVVDEQRNAERLSNSESNQSPHAGAPVPGYPGLYLIAAGKDVGTSELFLFDTKENYFLPGLISRPILDQPDMAVSDGLDDYVYYNYRSTTYLGRVRVLRTP